MAEAKSASGALASQPVERPLSPHLQVYRMTISMFMSIMHRMTGAALYFGTLLLAAWLVSAAIGPEAFDTVNGLFNTVLGKLVLIGYTWALFNHALGGIRHFIWDSIHGYDLKTVDRMSWMTLLGSLALTGAVWGYVVASRGGL